MKNTALVLVEYQENKNRYVVERKTFKPHSEELIKAKKEYRKLVRNACNEGIEIMQCGEAYLFHSLDWGQNAYILEKHRLYSLSVLICAYQQFKSIKEDALKEHAKLIEKTPSGEYIVLYDYSKAEEINTPKVNQLNKKGKI